MFIFSLMAGKGIGAGLDGATGNIFKFDSTLHSFELLKETEYDPKTDLGQSRFTVYWTDRTTVTQVEEKENFAGITGPVLAEFHGLDNPNFKALQEGKPFVARVATLFLDSKEAGGVTADERHVVGQFTPDGDNDSRGGIILIDGKAVKVSLRRQNSHLTVRKPLRPAELAGGLWKTTIHGAEVGDRFEISSMEVTPLVDPRTIDDPKLPRVLIIGDSISMNYEEIAKSRLKDVANYHRNEGNSFSTAQGVRNMELWLGNYQEKGLHWDVIQFNHGLHDLKQAYDKDSDTFGDYAVPIADYQANLEKEIAILKKTGAKLIWCSTTPVPNDIKGTYARREGAEIEFNKAALEVMNRHPEILINDLHHVVSNSLIFDNWRKSIDVHFYTKEEQAVLGDAVATAVRTALGENRRPGGGPID